MDWSKSERTDLRMISDMKSAGWTSEFHYQDVLARRTTPENPPLHGVSFSKGVRRVWQARDGWMSADVIDGDYVNHKLFRDLYEVLIGEQISQ